MSEAVPKAERRLHATQLRTLTSAAGWGLLVEELDRREQAAVESMLRRGATLEEYAAAAAEVRTIRAIRKYPTERAESLLSSLEGSDG